MKNHVNLGKIQSKTRLPSAKNKNFANFLTPYSQRTYDIFPSRRNRKFQSNTQVYPTIEGSPFMAPSELLQVHIIFSSGFYPGLSYEQRTMNNELFYAKNPVLEPETPIRPKSKGAQRCSFG